MAKYIESEAAEKILYDGCHTIDGRECLDDVVELWHMIQTIPAADVRPVVLCRDCDMWNEWDHAGHESLGNYRCSCAYWTSEDGPVRYTSPMDFCSYAEKKDCGEKMQGGDA